MPNREIPKIKIRLKNSQNKVKIKSPRPTGISSEKFQGSQKRKLSPGKNDKGKSSKNAKSNVEDIHILQLSDDRSMESIDSNASGTLSDYSQISAGQHTPENTIQASTTSTRLSSDKIDLNSTDTLENIPESTRSIFYNQYRRDYQRGKVKSL